MQKNVNKTEIQCGSRVRVPFTKKTYFEMSKKFDKKFNMHISTVYVCSSSFKKN
jgi:hypothetical protein